MTYIQRDARLYICATYFVEECRCSRTGNLQLLPPHAAALPQPCWFGCDVLLEQGNRILSHLPMSASASAQSLKGNVVLLPHSSEVRSQYWDLQMCSLQVLLLTTWVCVPVSAHNVHQLSDPKNALVD